jgi:hypothetical protein
MATTSKKHGIELHFGRGRKLRLLSYAVWVNGNCYVDHVTTRANRRDGHDLQRLVEIERRHYSPALPII